MNRYDVWATERLKARVLAALGEGIREVESRGEDEAIDRAAPLLAAAIIEVLTHARLEDYETLRTRRGA